MTEKDSWKPGFDRTKLGTVLPTKLPTAADHEHNLPKQEVNDYSSSLPVDTGPQQQNKQGAGGDQKNPQNQQNKPGQAKPAARPRPQQ